MKLVNNFRSLLEYRGMKYTPATMPLSPSTIFGWILNEDVHKDNSAPGVLEFRWSGFQLADTSEETKELLLTREVNNNGEKFATTGGGLFIVDNILLQGDITAELEQESKVELSVLLKELFAMLEFDKPLLVSWVPLDERPTTPGFTIVQLAISTPCTEEEYRCFIHLHSQEVLAAKLSGLKDGIGFETSEGRTLQ